jgi:hypothetical protein
LSRGDARAQSQDRRRAFQGLNATLFIDTEHDRVGWRLHVKTYDIAQLLDEVRIFAELEVLDPMRLKLVSVPNALYGAETYAFALRHLARTPMGPILRNSFKRRFNDFGVEAPV